MQIDENGPATARPSTKRKGDAASMGCEPPCAPPAPLVPPPTGRIDSSAALAASGAAAGGGVDVGAGMIERGLDTPRDNICRRTGKANNLDLSVSCLEGSTMRIPLQGKTVPFRVAKRRGRGISSVVFECERERESGEDGSLPHVVTVKVGIIS